jgi:DNA-binding GntR family transcriptional regulator
MTAYQVAKLRDAIVDDTRRQILGGTLPPGAPISERALSEAHGVSRVPVREALIQLAEKGLVRLIPGRGAFVRTMTLDEIRELYEVRESLEGRAARGAAEHAPKADFIEYEQKFLRCLSEKDTVNAQDLMMVSNGFHDLIARLCHNGLLMSLLSNIRDQVSLTRSQAYRNVTKDIHIAGIEEHLAILRAIVAEDGDNAELLMRRHIRSWMNHQLLSST